IFWADLEPHVGREQAGDRRPVLVVSNDGANRAFDVVTVIPLTKLEGKDRAVRRWEVQLPGDPVGNGYTCLALPHQVRTISKMRLLEPAGRLVNVDAQYRVEGALLDHLGIAMED